MSPSGLDQDDYNWLVTEVRTLGDDRGLEAARSFQAWCLEFVHGVDRDDAIDQSDTLAGGDDGIDGWHDDPEDGTIHLWQCKWTDDIATVSDVTPARELAAGLKRLLEPAPTPPLNQKIQFVSALVRAALPHGKNIVLNLGVATKLSDDAVKRTSAIVEECNEAISNWLSENDSTNQNDASTNGSTVRLEIYDLARLVDEHMSRSPSHDTLRGKAVDFKLHSEAHLLLEKSGVALPAGWEAAVVSLNGKDLGDVATKYGSKLFALNVRYALGRNVRIANLRDSIVREADAPYFWLYNNGITILADAFKINKKHGQWHTITITNPQIVNGCQTVTAFRIKYAECHSSACVMARVIVAPKGEDGALQANKIARYTNSQSPVLARDLLSNDPVQARLAGKFDNLSPPWFYERKRGEWNTLTAARKARYKTNTGEERRLTNEEIGQSFRALSEPAQSIKSKSTLWDDEELYRRIFDGRRSAELLLFPTVLRRAFDEFWKRGNVRGAACVDPVLLSSEHLSIIASAKNQVVLHSIALVSRLISDQEPNPDDARLILRATPKLLSTENTIRYDICSCFHEALRLAEERPDMSFKHFMEQPDNAAFNKMWDYVRMIRRRNAGEQWRTNARDEFIKLAST
jgi:hypothetical protein